MVCRITAMPTILVYFYCKPEEVNSLTLKFSACIYDLCGWIQSNRLKVNADKIECVWVTTRQRQSTFTAPNLTVGGSIIVPTKGAPNLTGGGSIIVPTKGAPNLTVGESIIVPTKGAPNLTVGGSIIVSTKGAPNLTVGGSIIVPTEGARNLGVFFDSKLDLKSHISNICRTCCFQLWQLRTVMIADHCNRRYWRLCYMTLSPAGWITATPCMHVCPFAT